MKHTVNVENAQEERSLFRGYKSLLREAVSFVLDKENFKNGAICDVSFVSREEIKRLNAEYRGKDSETDVLSFPMNDSFDDVSAGDLEKGKVILGDVIICPDYIFYQAKDFNNTFAEETVYMAIHSVLHLLGYDHIKEKDAKIMKPKQDAYFEEFMKKKKEEKQNG